MKDKLKSLLTELRYGINNELEEIFLSRKLDEILNCVETESILQPLQLKESDFEITKVRGFSDVYEYKKDCINVSIVKSHLYGKMYTYYLDLYVCNRNIDICGDEKVRITFKSFSKTIEFINQKLAEIFNAVKGE